MGGDVATELNHVREFFETTVHLVQDGPGEYQDIRALIASDAAHCEDIRDYYCVGFLTSHWHLRTRIYKILNDRYGVSDPAEQNRIMNAIAIDAVIGSPFEYLKRRSWETVRFSLSWYSYIAVVHLTEPIRPSFRELYGAGEYEYLLVRAFLHYLNPIYYMQFIWLFALGSVFRYREDPNISRFAYLQLWVPIAYFTFVAISVKWGIDRIRFPAEPFIYAVAAYGSIWVFRKVKGGLATYVGDARSSLATSILLMSVYVLTYPVQRVIALVTGIEIAPDD
ncbi:MAG: hypothetical protein CME19_18165 [Gemmatimonadetes bacterium]|nr:hypothetical protein [Gemmatimonadota bacterium]